MRNKGVLLLIAGLMIVGAAVADRGMSSENKGAVEIMLDGGSRGNVPFPHHLHQDNLNDCQICQSVFEQKTGSIAELKARGKLKKRYVMNQLCTQCHRQGKRAGEKSGPTACAECHIK